MFEIWKDDPDKKAWQKKMCTPMPFECLRRRVTLTGREAEISRQLYIIATRYQHSILWSQLEKAESREGWETDNIDAKHDAMVEAPAELANMLDSYQAKLGLAD